MASAWYYSRGDEKFGPYSTEQLRRLARTGKLLPTDMLRQEDVQEWRPAASFNQIFQKALVEQWLYSTDGTKQGPVSLGELKGLVAAGKLHWHDKICKKDSNDWIEARTNTDLFPPSESSGRADAPIPVAAPAANREAAIEWFIVRPDQKYGPYSLEQLKQFAAAKQMAPNDKVWKDGLSKEVEAMNIRELFPIFYPQ